MKQNLATHELNSNTDSFNRILISNQESFKSYLMFLQNTKKTLFNKFLTELKEVLPNTEQTKELKNNLRLVWDMIDNLTDLTKLSGDFYKILLKSNLLTFREIVNKYKNTSFKRQNSDVSETGLWCLLSKKNPTREIYEEDLLQKEDLEYLYKSVHAQNETFCFFDNLDLWTKCLKKGVISVKDSIDKLKMTTQYYHFLEHEQYFDKLLELDEFCKQSDVQYALDRIDKQIEIEALSVNGSLLKYVLKNFMLIDGSIKKYDDVLKEKERGNADFFSFCAEICAAVHADNTELSELLEMNKQLYDSDLSAHEKSCIVQIAQQNTEAMQKLQQILSTALLDQYNFDQLEQILRKASHKKRIKMNL